MSSPPQDPPEGVFDASIMALEEDVTSGLTLFTTAPSANEYLGAKDGPFAALKQLVADHTSQADQPSFEPLPPLEDVVRNIVESLWGHISPGTVESIGDILDAAIKDDLGFEVFLETCIAAYAQKRGRSYQEMMRKFRSHNSSEVGQSAWQTWQKLHPGLTSQEATDRRKLEQLRIQTKYPDRADEANSFFDKVLIHYGDMILSKDDRAARHNESLYILQKITGKYAAQVSALSSTHPVGVAVVGFVADETVPPDQSVVAFTSSPVIAAMVKALGLPFTESAAVSMRNLYEGVSAFSPYQPNISKQRNFLNHINAFTSPVMSTREESDFPSLMKAVVENAKKSVHFNNELAGYSGDPVVKLEAVEENDVDLSTPVLRQKDGLAIVDRKHGVHTKRRTDCAVQLKAMIQKAAGINDLGVNWRAAKIFSFLLEHHLRFSGWHRGVRRLNKSLPSDWTPRESARCIMQLCHDDPLRKLRVEMMTDDEYARREVLHYEPDAEGRVDKYILPEHEVRRGIGKTSSIGIRARQSRKRKASSPDSANESNVDGGDDITHEPPKRTRKKPRAASKRAARKIVPSHTSTEASEAEDESAGQSKPMRPENKPTSWSEARGLKSEPKGQRKATAPKDGPTDQSDDAMIPENGTVPETPTDKSPESPRSPSPVVQNDVFTECAMPRMPSVVPPIRLIEPTPHSTPAKPTSFSRAESSKTAFLTVNERETSRPRSETPSSMTSLGGESPSFESFFKCARNSIWRKALKIGLVLRSEALLSENVELAVKIDIVNFYVKKREQPPENLVITKYSEIVNDVGNEFCSKGVDVEKVAQEVALLLDQEDGGDERDEREKDDVLDKWIGLLPA